MLKIPVGAILNCFKQLYFRQGTTNMTQDELKQAVARAAIEHIPPGIIGVGTGSTANYFIDELAKIKHKIDGAVASSEATAQRLKSHGIQVLDLNNAGELAVSATCQGDRRATHPPTPVDFGPRRAQTNGPPLDVQDFPKPPVSTGSVLAVLDFVA